MFKNKISVIVPIYNSEKYLRKCLDSIINQTYPNLEIILVNDGSSDSSASLINEYAAKDNRIIAIHKDNGGIGSAYRVAFECMTGNYISFVDSDDYIDLTMYEELVNILSDQNPDILHFGRVVFNDKGEISETFPTSDAIIEGSNNVLSNHFTYIKDPSLASRIFKKHLFDNVTLFDQNIGIDEMVIIQVLSKCEKAIFCSKIFYYTYAQANSISRINYSKKKINEGIHVHRFICNFIEKNNPNHSSFIYLKYLHYLILIYNIARVNKQIAGSEEINCLKNDLIRYYFMEKNTFKYNRETWRFKLKVYIFVKYNHLFPFVSFSILLYDIFKKHITST